MKLSKTLHSTKYYILKLGKNTQKKRFIEMHNKDCFYNLL